jgi:hypothetical protein
MEPGQADVAESSAPVLGVVDKGTRDHHEPTFAGQYRQIRGHAQVLLPEALPAVEGDSKVILGEYLVTVCCCEFTQHRDVVLWEYARLASEAVEALGDERLLGDDLRAETGEASHVLGEDPVRSPETPGLLLPDAVETPKSILDALQLLAGGDGDTRSLSGLCR